MDLVLNRREGFCDKLNKILNTFITIIHTPSSKQSEFEKAHFSGEE